MVTAGEGNMPRHKTWQVLEVLTESRFTGGWERLQCGLHVQVVEGVRVLSLGCRRGSDWRALAQVSC